MRPDVSRAAEKSPASVPAIMPNVTAAAPVSESVEAIAPVSIASTPGASSVSASKPEPGLRVAATPTNPVPARGSGARSAVKATPTDGVLVYQDSNAVLQERPGPRLTESAQEDTTKATTNASFRNPLPSLPREIADANLVGRVEPQYPKSAIEQHIQGGVVLEIDVNQSGAVQGVYPVSGHPLLTTAAIDAVRQWRFSPYLRDGKPVNFETHITLNFALP